MNAPDREDGNADMRPDEDREIEPSLVTSAPEPWRLRPSTLLIVCVLALFGASMGLPPYLAAACFVVAAIAAVVWLGETVNAFEAARALQLDRPIEAPSGRAFPRIQFELRTLLIAVAVAALILGLSIWNRHSYCAVAYEVTTYGVPFECVSSGGGHVSVDWPCAAADLGAGLALTIGLSTVWKHLTGRRRSFGRTNSALTPGPSHASGRGETHRRDPGTLNPKP